MVLYDQASVAMVSSRRSLPCWGTLLMLLLTSNVGAFVLLLTPHIRTFVLLLTSNVWAFILLLTPHVWAFTLVNNRNLTRCWTPRPLLLRLLCLNLQELPFLLLLSLHLEVLGLPHLEHS